MEERVEVEKGLEGSRQALVSRTNLLLDFLIRRQAINNFRILLNFKLITISFEKCAIYSKISLKRDSCCQKQN